MRILVAPIYPPTILDVNSGSATIDMKGSGAVLASSGDIRSDISSDGDTQNDIHLGQVA